MSKKSHKSPNLIADNRKASYDYALEDRFEAGLVLEGWEVKAMRAGRCQLRDSYVVIKDSEAWLINSHISPLATASTHIDPAPERSRKLLLTKRELGKLIGAVQQKGYTLIPLNLHWKNNRAKLDFALAKGKKLYDKRESEKRRDWQRQKQRLMKNR